MTHFVFFLSFFLAMPWVLASPKMLSAYPLCASVFICGLHPEFNTAGHTSSTNDSFGKPPGNPPHLCGVHVIGTLWHLGYSFILIYAASLPVAGPAVPAGDKHGATLCVITCSTPMTLYCKVCGKQCKCVARSSWHSPMRLGEELWGEVAT